MLQDLFARLTLGERSGAPPRTVLVFAHPDDEVIALGARLVGFRSALLVHVTDGVPRNGADSRVHGFTTLEEYRQCREGELRRALQLAGLEKIQRVQLQIPDQEVSLALAQLIRELGHIFIQQRPEVVFTHPYEGGHPDHDACAFAVHRAAGLMEPDGLKPPMIVEGAFYHAAADGIRTGSFLPHVENSEEIQFVLSADGQLRKQRLFECFPSQEDTLRYFATERECFRIAPRYDFHRPPHAGPVFYDHYAWGMISQHFCELALAADVAGAGGTA
jgi:N-acetylglucosamine malate deacetylase 2